MINLPSESVGVDVFGHPNNELLVVIFTILSQDVGNVSGKVVDTDLASRNVNKVIDVEDNLIAEMFVVSVHHVVDSSGSTVSENASNICHVVSPSVFVDVLEVSSVSCMPGLVTSFSKVMRSHDFVVDDVVDMSNEFMVVDTMSLQDSLNSMVRVVD